MFFLTDAQNPSDSEIRQKCQTYETDDSSRKTSTDSKSSDATLNTFRYITITTHENDSIVFVYLFRKGIGTRRRRDTVIDIVVVFTFVIRSSTVEGFVNLAF